MSTDAGSPITPRRPFGLDLPRILKLTIRRVPFEAPKLLHFESSLAKYSEAIEFVAEVEKSLPVRAYGPALFVGDREIHQSEVTDKNRIRFLEFEPDSLKPGEPISWGWMKDPVESRQRTEFIYELPSPDAASV
jgi:hypothetical protein